MEKYPVRIDRILPSLEYYSEVALLLEEAQEYLNSYSWCLSISNGWLFSNLGKVLCIFLYNIENSQSPEDNLIWIIVGDFPPAYLDSEGVKNTREVVEAYIYLVKDWIEHAKNGESLEHCYPLLTSWTEEHIEMLQLRAELLEKSILPQLLEISVKEIYVN